MYQTLVTAGIAIPITDAIIMGCTIHGEMSSEASLVQVRVGQIILNRFHAGWAPTIHDVCLAHAQFDCWDVGSADRLRVFMDYAHKDAGLMGRIELAQRMIDAQLSAPEIKHADSYFSIHAVKARPYWAKAPAQLIYTDQVNEYWQERLR